MAETAVADPLKPVLDSILDNLRPTHHAMAGVPPSGSWDIDPKALREVVKTAIQKALAQSNSAWVKRLATMTSEANALKAKLDSAHAEIDSLMLKATPGPKPIARNLPAPGDSHAA